MLKKKKSEYPVCSRDQMKKERSLEITDEATEMEGCAAG